MQTLTTTKKRRRRPGEDTLAAPTVSTRADAFGRLQAGIGNGQVQRLVELQREPEAKKPSGREAAKAAFLEGDASYKAGDYAAAMAKYQESYDLSHEPLLLYNIAQCERNLGATDAAIEGYERFLEEAGKSAGPFGAKARKWIRTLKGDKFPDAIAAFKAADIAYKGGDFATALTGYRESYESSKEPLLLYNIAQCYRNLGNLQQAVAHYKLFLTQDTSDNPFRKKAEKWVGELEPKLDTSLYTEYVAQFGSPQ